MDWTLRKKILSGYGVVLLLLAIVLGWALVNLLRLGSASESILSENYRSIQAAESMIDALEREDSATLLYLQGHREKGLQQFRTNQATFLQWLGRAKDNITVEGEQAILSRIDSAYTQYLTHFSRLLQDSSRAESIYYDEMLPTFSVVRQASFALHDLNREAMFAVSDRAGRVSRWAVWSVGAVGLVALVSGLFFSLVLSNRLARPVRDMRGAAERIAAGDYDVTVPARGSDELGRLAMQFNEMTAELRRFRDMNVEKLIAEKRKSEAIVQSIDDGLVVVDAEFAIQHMNPAGARVLGAEHMRVEGRHFLEVTRNEQLFEYVRDATGSGFDPAPGKQGQEEAFLKVDQDDGERHFQPLTVPVRGDEGEHKGVILHLRDVTKLRKLDRLKSEFVATASHELKTPLTSIEMGIGLLQEHLDGQLDERDQKLFHDTREDVMRLRTLVNDLLDLSKIESGKLEIDREAVPVPVLFEKAMQNLRAQAEEHGIALGSNLPERLPNVKADANKVTWVLNNLISNALRYTGPGGCVDLSAGCVGGTVHLSVTDDGTGIAPEDQPRIFDKFVQVSPEGARGGSGLGLAICKEIVHGHGGRIWVDSTPGKGSTFTFTLPVVS